MSKINVKEFVDEAFDYLNILTEVSINRSANRYLLEYIAFGFAKYGETVNDFEEHVNDWIRMLVKIYPELSYDYANHQIKAVIDLVDQLIVVDDDLIESLRYNINILKKYGLLIEYTVKGHETVSTTIAHFFEYIEKLYPQIKDRYKGLGSSPAQVSKEVIMDPRTRRLIRLTMEDAETIRRMGNLVGDGKENKNARKEMLLNFPFTVADIDN